MCAIIIIVISSEYIQYIIYINMCVFPGSLEERDVLNTTELVLLVHMYKDYAAILILR